MAAWCGADYSMRFCRGAAQHVNDHLGRPFAAGARPDRISVDLIKASEIEPSQTSESARQH